MKTLRNGLVSHPEPSWDYLPYNNVTWADVESSEALAEHKANREFVNLACKMAIEELEHINNIEEERKQIMILELGLCMDKYVSAYSDHETFYIRQTGQDFPDQIENLLWEMNEVVEEVKDAIRDLVPQVAGYHGGIC